MESRFGMEEYNVCEVGEQKCDMYITIGSSLISDGVSKSTGDASACVTVWLLMQ